MSLSPFDSFQSRFVTYLLNFPRILRRFKQPSFHLIAINRQNCEQFTNNGRCTFPDFTPFSIQLQQMLFAVLGRSKTVMFGAHFYLAMNMYVLSYLYLSCLHACLLRRGQSLYPLSPTKSHYISKNAVIFSKETSEVGQTRGVKS